MKTITLTEESYRRLVFWKVSNRDSFSKVIERVAPKKGTMTRVLKAAQQLPPLDDGRFEAMETAARSERSWKEQRDPWNDLWIAATALQHGLPIITRNHDEFAAVEGLEVWKYQAR